MSDAPDEVSIDLPEHTYQQANMLAEQLNKTVPQVLEQAVNELSAHLFLAEADVQYAALRSDPVGWNEELQERAAWDVTLLDGLEDDPYL